MNYEEKYKNALALARDYYKANLKLNNADENLILEDIFPELKESEDERIRKELIEYFNVYPKDYYGELKKSQILAWLEKQGEQKYFDYENVNIQQKDFALKIDEEPWSEEDEVFLRRAINAAEDVYPLTVNWLKSLKSRYTWKPSEEQINAIEVAIAYMTDESETPTTPKVLSELLEQLKKLK